MISQLKEKNAALLYADTERSVLGTPSRLSEPIGQHCVLKHTINRLRQAERIDDILIFCPAQQLAAIRKLSSDPSVEIVGLQEDVGISPLIRQRKWSLTSWRGGLGEATLFDEQPFSEEMIQIARQHDIFLALSVPSDAVLLDPQILDQLIEHHYRHRDDMRFTFSLAAPGLSCCAYRIDLLADLVEAQTSIGKLLAYDPDQPRSDYINHQCTLPTRPELSGTNRRYLADTQRGMDALSQIMAKNTGDFLAEDIITVIEKQIDQTDRFPREIEIEINTDVSLRVPGYPHNRDDLGRGPMPLQLFEKIVSDCQSYDDICITIGGFGEPLVHDQLFDMIKSAKQAGIFGINIVTDARNLGGDIADKLLESPVDILSVSLDANSPQGYRQLKGQDCFDQIIANIETFHDKSHDVGGPLVVPTMVKMRENFVEMEAFFDRWTRRCGFALLQGYNSYAGQIENREIMDMSPPARRPCRRLSQSLTILADGSVVTCEQDFLAQHSLGNVADQSIESLWQCSPMQQLRQEHNNGNFACHPLCSNCKEWHR